MDSSICTKYQEVVDFFGTQSKTAHALNVAQPSVNAWVLGKSRMSAITALQVEKLTQGKFKAVELCPSLAKVGM